MADITTPDLLPGLTGNVVQKRLVDMGDGTFAPMTVTRLATSSNSVGTVNLGSIGGAATAANQAQSIAALSALAAPYAAAPVSPLAALVSDTVPHVFGPFVPQLVREIWVTLNATAAASGTAKLLRSTDGGVTKIGLTACGAMIGSYAFNAVTGVIANEIVSVETEAAATYYLSITLTAGTVAVRVAQ